ncbi:unnamed protein product [Periconia digitata]|uniref:Uncharacterized protein n=1 Tax=Periconia digitata TaxID=1303443 RepID=A0A9W4UPH4_9PLEO|nr:unnamed protein product [Periconia digitata]
MATSNCQTRGLSSPCALVGYRAESLPSMPFSISRGWLTRSRVSSGVAILTSLTFRTCLDVFTLLMPSLSLVYAERGYFSETCRCTTNLRQSIWLKQPALAVRRVQCTDCVCRSLGTVPYDDCCDCKTSALMFSSSVT